MSLPYRIEGAREEKGLPTATPLYYTPEQPYSVLVWVDGRGVAHAKDGETQAVIAEGSDHASVLQAAIDACPDGGTVAVHDGLSLTSSVYLRSRQRVHLLGTVYIDADVDGFVIPGSSTFSVLEGGRIAVRSQSFTRAAILVLTGTAGDTLGHRVGNMLIELPSGQGYGVYLKSVVAWKGIAESTFENIYILHGNQGVRVETANNGWVTTCRFVNILVREPTDYGFAIVNTGYSYEENMHLFVYTEIGYPTTVAKGAFYIKNTGRLLHNVFIGCAGIDYQPNTYFLYIDPSSTSAPERNVWIGNVGSMWLPSTDMLQQDVWIDTFNWRSMIRYDANSVYHIMQPRRDNTDMVVQIAPSKNPASFTGLSVLNNPNSTENLYLTAQGYAFTMMLYRTSAGTLKPLIFFVNDAGTTTEVARIDTDKNFKFKTIAVPTSAPSTPAAGSMYFDTSTGKLYVYDGSAWKSVTLT